MAVLRWLRGETLEIFVEGARSGAAFTPERLSLKTRSGLVTAAAVGSHDISGLLESGEDLVLPAAWSFGSAIRFEFGTAAIDLVISGRKAGRASWRALSVEMQNDRIRFAFSNLEIASDLLPSLPIGADLTLVFSNGGIVERTLNLSRPVATEPSLFVDWGANKEIRASWRGNDGAVSLPGFSIKPSAAPRYHLSLRVPSGQPAALSLLAELQANQTIVATGGFAWERTGDREIQTDETPASAAGPFELTIRATSAKILSLATWKLQESGLPTFFQQLDSVPATAAITEPVALTTGAWNVSLKVRNAVAFPFLKAATQSIQAEAADGFEADFDQRALSGKLKFTFRTGALTFAELSADVAFSWETFSLRVDHQTGIQLRAAKPAKQNHLGLTWALETTESGDTPHWFTLATKDFHYEIQLAPTARFVLEYSQATKPGEPIRFVCSDFKIGTRGISLTAEITDDPARLNGVDTRFTFHGTRLEIIENAIRDFTLMGSGPLPPDLVGDATADISLQFKQQNNALTLVAAAAELQGTDLLKAETTHFEFQIDALGLKFVRDSGSFHLYFTLTGSATYSPEPFDEDEDPLHFLSTATIELVECPLTGDATVLAKHINFLIEFNEPLEFKFLGAFTFELRAIGFLCSAEQFDGDAAMQLTGQVMFSPEGKDTKSAKVDFHGMLIAAPAPGDLLPRVHLDTLGVEIEYGDAFHLSGEVEFRNTDTEKGFLGEGLLEIKGMPTIAASFAFLRVRLDEESQWVSAWFIFLEVRRVSFKIPVVEIFLREVGLGFGYRFTLTSIRTADQEADIKKLIKALKTLSRTAGDLSKRDRWAVDLEKRGEDPRWTIVLRALFSQTSASASPLKYNKEAEEKLACTFLFDVVAAFRSDLTFFMAARGWINTNYADFDSNKDLREKPFVSGFILLSARQKRFLAHVASNPDGEIGDRPPVPAFVKKALSKVEFSATLLIEPGLFHFELGWPNMLRWKEEFGPLKVEFRGGLIFRVTPQVLVMGISFQARATLQIRAEVSLVVVGARLEADALAAFGARLIAVTSLTRTDVAVYAAIGLDIRIAIRLILWIGLDLGFFKITKEFTLSFTVGFTAGLEMGIRNTSLGLQGSGTVFVEVMGHSLHFAASFAHNAATVTEARNITTPFLKLGLEATDVEGVPGVADALAPQPAVAAAPPPAQPVIEHPAASAPVTGTGPASETVVVAPKPTTAAARTGSFKMPEYVAFVLHKAATQPKTYFVLMPKGENETGFLPPPPAAASTASDFTLTFPANTKPDTLERFDPLTGTWTAVNGQPSVSWRANWDAVLFRSKDGTTQVKLRDYLKGAFILNKPMVQEFGGVPVGDPVPLPLARRIEDDRVHNPTDSAFEAAVRGAVEQFRGSPFFKLDRDLEYDRALENAFNPATTVYQTAAAGGSYDPESEHAIQFRSSIVHDLIEDFRAYVARVTPDGNGPDADLAAKSIPFQMGLVFRARKTANPPAWLTRVVSQANQKPTIVQRGQTASTRISTFNVASAGFAEFSPKFERVRQYTSSNTIALAWDLVWDRAPEESATGAQASPEHHLLHYQVRRRALDGGGREVTYTVKNAAAVNLKGGTLQILQPRFKLVDNFNQESLEQQAALPADGLSYLYTIAPCDVAGNLGRPLTLVATRFPDEPPAVPADGELAVSYNFNQRPTLLTGDQPIPTLIKPASVQVQWRDPVRREGPVVPVSRYRLIFRRSAALPTGSFGVDAVSAQPRNKSLPTSNARPLPTDVKIEIETAAIVTGDEKRKSAAIPLDTLVKEGVFPRDPAVWRPESWSVFFQTISVNDVPSALAPVQILLRFSGSGKTEERKPGELEFVPSPIQLPLLPPEDQQATPGLALFPMPAGALTFAGGLSNIGFRRHPESTRCIRFHWNQGPSARPDYPVRLHAGYTLLELNIDANTQQTFDNADLLADALWDLQEVRMLPAGELLLAPGNTLATSQWEAWYPSTVARMNHRAQNPAPPGSESVLSSWYSWRDSYLEWPAPNTDLSLAIHSELNAILTRLRERFVVDLQVSPPLQEMDFAGLMQSTAAGPDPYGWGILQRFGLSIALSLRDSAGNVVSGAALLAAVQQATPATGEIRRFLHVELLFQPSKSVSLATGTPSEASLLGIVQISLRPAIVQLFRHFKVTFTAAPGAAVDLSITPRSETTLLNPLDPASGEVALQANRESKRSLTMPLTGEQVLLFRCQLNGANDVRPAFIITSGNTPITPTVANLEPTADESAYFTAPAAILAQSAATPGNDVQVQWSRFKTYAESLNSNQSGAEKRIAIPTDLAGIAAALPDVMSWTARFFDHAGNVANGRTGIGPWAATAYPRSTAQVFAAPDAAGRLTHDYLLTDKWAHNFRYYIRPFGRYDLLWRSLLQSPIFSPSNNDPLPAKTPDPRLGALDVVLDRTHPVAMPVVLRSGRLDPPSAPGRPAPPGATWEVIVAKHPEQALAERNQTLFRQLSYRGIAFALLRQFAFNDWIEKIETAIGGGHRLQITPVHDQFPALTQDGALNIAPDHLNLRNLSSAQARSLDVPLRLGTFQQGAMILQWNALPFFYGHRLLLVAQTAHTVSPVNDIIQADFEYRAPEPRGLAAAIASTGDTRLRRISIPLAELWDALPPAAQSHWEAERPNRNGARPSPNKPASIPDLETVYQIVHLFNGNLEVQAEIFFENRYKARQLGKNFLVQGAPSFNAPTNELPSYVVRTPLQQITRIQLQRTYSNILQPARGKVSFDTGNVAAITGVLRPDDVVRILGDPFAQMSAGILPLSPAPAAPFDEPSAFPQWRAFFRSFYSLQRVNAVFDVSGFGGKLDFPQLTSDTEIPAILKDRLTLAPNGSVTWRGTITPLELTRLGAFLNAMPRHRIHRDQLLEVAEQHEFHDQNIRFGYPFTTRPLSAADLPSILAGKLFIDTSTWRLTMTRGVTPAQTAAARALKGDADFKTAIEQLLQLASAALPEEPTVSVTASPRIAIRRVQIEEIAPLFDPADIAPLQIPDDLAPTNSSEMFWQWRKHAPLPLPAQVYKDRVEERFRDTDPRFVELFGGFIDHVAETIAALGNTTATQPAAFSMFLRCRGPLSQEEAARLRQLSPNDTGIEETIRDVHDRQALDAFANDWFTTTAVSARLDSLPAEQIDFPDPTQLTLVWKGALTADARDALAALAQDKDEGFRRAVTEILTARPAVPLPLIGRLTIEASKLNWTGGPPTTQQNGALATLSGDAEFNRALKRLRDAIAISDGPVTVPISDVLTGLAPIGFDQVPSELRTKISVVTENGRHTAVRWTGAAPMLDADVALLRNWPAMAQFASAVDAIAQFQTTLDPPPADPGNIPRPAPSELPPALASKLSIGPDSLSWTGRLLDPSHIDMLRQLRGDVNFDTAIGRVIAFLEAAPVIALNPAPSVRPSQSELPDALRNNLLIGKAAIRYHGIMTVDEGRAIRAAFNHLPDQDAIARLFHESQARGLQGSELMIRTRRGDAAPSAMKPFQAEPLSAPEGADHAVS